MKPIAELAGRALRWEKASRASGGAYQLLDGDDVAATLKFRSVWGSLATAESADGCWTFKRVGFLQTRVAIRRCDSDEEIAFTTDSGEPLMRFRKIGGILRLSSAVEILPAGASFTSAPWLVMLGWYLAVQMHNDAASASGAVAAAT